MHTKACWKWQMRCPSHPKYKFSLRHIHGTFSLLSKSEKGILHTTRDETIMEGTMSLTPPVHDRVQHSNWGIPQCGSRQTFCASLALLVFQCRWSASSLGKKNSNMCALPPSMNATAFKHYVSPSLINSSTVRFPHALAWLLRCHCQSSSSQQVLPTPHQKNQVHFRMFIPLKKLVTHQ